MKTPQETRDAIAKAAELLSSTEKGKDVLQHLHQLLAGEISGLDGRGWDAALSLLKNARYGYHGTVRETIDSLVGEHKKRRTKSD